MKKQPFKQIGGEIEQILKLGIGELGFGCSLS